MDQLVQLHGESLSLCSRISRTHKQDYDREKHLCIVSAKGFWNTSFSPQQSGASTSTYKSVSCFHAHKVPLLVPALICFWLFNSPFPPSENSLGPLQGTVIVWGTMQFTKWCPSWVKCSQTKELSQHILAILSWCFLISIKGSVWTGPSDLRYIELETFFWLSGGLKG